MDSEKDFVANDDEKSNREQLLQRYEMSPIYSTYALRPSLTLLSSPTEDCSVFQRSSSPRTSRSRLLEKPSTSNPFSRLLLPPPARMLNAFPSLSKVPTPARADRSGPVPAILLICELNYVLPPYFLELIIVPFVIRYGPPIGTKRKWVREHLLVIHNLHTQYTGARRMES